MDHCDLSPFEIYIVGNRETAEKPGAYFAEQVTYHHHRPTSTTVIPGRHAARTDTKTK